MRQAGGFQALQVLFGARDDFPRNARKLRNRQAVALAGWPRQHSVQEHDSLVMLGGIEVHVVHQRLAFRQNRQLEIVRREQRVGTQLCQAFCRRPGQRQTVEGAGAAPDFIHQHQAFIGGIVQDVGCFAHFHHERRASAGQIVTGADAGEDPVNQRQLAAGGGHEAADMGQQDDQRRLAHVSGFTAHVRAGDDQHACAVVQCQIVGHERRTQHLLDHRVAALFDAHARLGDEARAVEVQVQRALCKVAQYVQLGQCSRCVLQRRKVADQVFEQRLVKHFLTSQRATFC